VKYVYRTKVGTYKNGKDKYKNVEDVWIPEFAMSPADHNIEEKAHGSYDVSEKVLDYAIGVLNSTPDGPESELAEYLSVLLDSRKIAKVDGTYFVPLIEQIDNSVDASVHTNINMTVTHTGRTSSSNPNVQNIPPVVKKFLGTRFKEGCLLESDFSQLEVCALAYLSDDRQLIDDLNNGVDVHYQTGKDVMGWKTPEDMTKHTRRIVKGVNFGIIYGGGVVTISNQTGADQTLVGNLIRAFYKRYPQVKMWQNGVRRIVDEAGAIVKDSPVVAGEYAKVAKFVSITGRQYTFVESLVPENYRRDGVLLNFKPTEIKNYPVQGFATADLMPILVGMLRYNPDISLLIAVVHDSTLFDCLSVAHATNTRNFLDRVVSYSLPRILTEAFGIPYKVKFRMDHEIKNHW
jgi:hypothetical protein